jgi:hypothetical protein
MAKSAPTSAKSKVGTRDITAFSIGSAQRIQMQPEDPTWIKMGSLALGASGLLGAAIIIPVGVVTATIGAGVGFAVWTAYLFTQKPRGA